MRTFIQPQRKAFTLVELLVVIAIILLLAAILFPVFGQARERARASSCLSNLKQQGLALQMYVEDWDHRIPLREYAITGDATHDYQSFLSGRRKKGTSGLLTTVWDQEYALLHPYMKNYQVRSCPSASSLSIRTSGDVSPSGTPYGYGFNQSYLFPGGSTAINSAAIEKASETIFLADTAYVLDANTLQTWTGNWAPSVGYPTTHARHQGFAGVAWADGHAKAMRVTMRTAPAFTAAQVAMWSKYNVGDILHPNYPKGSAGQNYYYMLVKPTI